MFVRKGCDDCTYKTNPDQYYLIITVEARAKYSIQRPDYFNSFERQRLLIDQSRTIMNMIPFDFELSCITRYTNEVLKDVFMTPLETLQGMSYCFLYLKEPKLLLQSLDNMNANLQKDHTLKTVIERVIDGDSARRKLFIEANLYHETPTLAEDFNF